VSCSGNKIVDSYSSVTFRSFLNVTPNYNIELMGNNDSLYDLSPGTQLFVRVGTACMFENR
jgi:hypothetical protein